MNITERKQEIKNQIDLIEDEELISEIARLLHLDNESDIPEWHKQILQERDEKYGEDLSQYKDWEEVKKDL